jgi:Domain of unknown function (DUF4365)
MYRPKYVAVSREGINHVRTVVERCNSIFQEISQHNDLGNDAYIEFIHDEQATSFCVAVQVKSGKSFLREKTALIASDKGHFEYWRNHILPIAGIVHDPERGLSYWTNITRFLREHPETVESGPFRITVPYENRFDEEHFNDFVQSFMLINLKGTLEENFGISLRYLANVDDENDAFQAVKSLFYFHRDKEAAWFYLVPYVSQTKQLEVRRLIVEYMSVATGNPDVLYGPELKIDAGISAFIRKCIGRQPIREFLPNLLECVDEEAYRRGTIGQSVLTLVEGIPEIMDELLFIVMDQGQSDHVRYHAALAHVLLGQSADENGEWEIEVIRRYIRSAKDGHLASLAMELVRTLEQYGGVSY